jgi:hypothetical protein
MKTKQRKELAAQIRGAIATTTNTPVQDRWKFEQHDTDVVVGMFRLRNDPANLKAFARKLERGKPWRAANGGAFKPNVPDIDAIVAFYGSAANAKAKIAEHLEIQGEYMEAGQVKACGKVLMHLDADAEKIDRAGFLRGLPKGMVWDGELLAKNPKKLPPWQVRDIPAVKKRFEESLAAHCKGDIELENKIKDLLTPTNRL